MDELSINLQDVFRDVFEDDKLILREDMTAVDLDGWDSLTHVNLIIAIERKLSIRFATAEISRLSEPGQNVGTMLEMIRRKRS